jgi:prevent-host-death family protein
MMTTSEAAKTKKISAAQAKAKLSELLARVSLTEERYVIERRGKPVAALVSVQDLEQLVANAVPDQENSNAFLELAGLWSGIMTDEEVDDFLKAVYEERARDTGRPVDLSNLLEE